MPVRRLVSPDVQRPGSALRAFGRLRAGRVGAPKVAPGSAAPFLPQRRRRGERGLTGGVSVPTGRVRRGRASCESRSFGRVATAPVADSLCTGPAVDTTVSHLPY